MCSLRRPTVLLIPILLHVSGCTDLKRPVGTESPPATSTSQKDTSVPFATRDFTTITLHPSGFTFKVPVDWVDWYAKHGNNLHLSRDQLARVEKPDQDEWDREFARICNASLPFDRCAAHVGGEGWGDDARSFGDLQVRVYDLLDPPSDLVYRIVKAVKAVAEVDDSRGESGEPWRRLLITYHRVHFDYEATAFVDFRLRKFRDRTIVFVFMYTVANSGTDIPSILQSARAD
jgi:hypothetical protein